MRRLNIQIFSMSEKKNQWKNKLNLKQIREIEENFKEDMIKFNYL